MESPPKPDYSFIMNPTANQPSAPNPSTFKAKKLLIIVGGGAFLLTLIAIAFSLIFSSGTNLSANRLRIATQHNEIIRVTELAKNKARDPASLNIASTTKLIFKSSESQIVALANRDQKVTVKQLTSSNKEKHDELLIEAEQNNRFDEAFLELLQELLINYQKELKATSALSDSKSEKKLLTDLSEQINTILNS
jgi:hypothetical protein